MSSSICKVLDPDGVIRMVVHPDGEIFRVRRFHGEVMLERATREIVGGKVGLSSLRRGKKERKMTGEMDIKRKNVKKKKKKKVK